METVDHPAHYGGADDPYEAIKVIEAWGLGFHLGSVLKYLRRAGRKPGAPATEDLRKAAWYLERAIQAAELGAERTGTEKTLEERPRWILDWTDGESRHRVANVSGAHTTAEAAVLRAIQADLVPEVPGTLHVIELLDGHQGVDAGAWRTPIDALALRG